MRMTIAAVGRMKAGPETELVERYLQRLKKAGNPLGLDFSGVVELAESRAALADERKRDEAQRLKAALPDKAATILLDERGRSFDSPAFADHLAALRDEGLRDLAFVIGGPDGLAPELRDGATLLLGFGALTWPHQIVRILLAEQLYRTTTILSGHPYHRA